METSLPRRARQRPRAATRRTSRARIDRDASDRTSHIGQGRGNFRSASAAWRGMGAGFGSAPRPGAQSACAVNGQAAFSVYRSVQAHSWRQAPRRSGRQTDVPCATAFQGVAVRGAAPSPAPACAASSRPGLNRQDPCACLNGSPARVGRGARLQSARALPRSFWRSRCACGSSLYRQKAGIRASDPFLRRMLASIQEAASHGGFAIGHAGTGFVERPAFNRSDGSAPYLHRGPDAGRRAVSCAKPARRPGYSAWGLADQPPAVSQEPRWSVQGRPGHNVQSMDSRLYLSFLFI